MADMLKTTIYLPRELKERLEELARRQGMSEAKLIRQALADFVDRRPPRPRLPLFSSGDPTLAERVDEILAEGFGRD